MHIRIICYFFEYIYIYLGNECQNTPPLVEFGTLNPKPPTPVPLLSPDGMPVGPDPAAFWSASGSTLRWDGGITMSHQEKTTHRTEDFKGTPRML